MVGMPTDRLKACGGAVSLSELRTVPGFLFAMFAPDLGYLFVA